MAAAARRLSAVFLLPLAAACRPKSSVSVGADGATTVTSGANVVRTNADGSVHVQSADGSAIDVSGGDARAAGAQAPSGPMTAARVVSDASSGAIVVGDDDLHQTIDCGSGGSVRITGSDNVLALTGTCARVSVVGSDNTLTIVAVGAIDTPGNDNTVSYRAGVGGREPAITNSGEDNTVSRGGRESRVELPQPAAGARF